MAARTVVFVVCSAVLLAVASRWIKGNLQIACAAAIATFFLTILFVRWEGVRLANVGEAVTRGSWGRFAMAFAAGLILPFLRSGLVMLMTGLRYERTHSLTLTGGMLILATYIALASREELAFRGYPLRMLEREFGAWAALFGTAALFAVEHALGGWTWWQAVFGSGIGALLFGAAALRTRGLAAPIGLHAAWNFGDTLLGGKGTPGLWRPVIDAGVVMEGVEKAQWAVYVFVMLAAAVALWLWPGRAMEPVES